jgi:hypothetical protein
MIRAAGGQGRRFRVVPKKGLRPSIGKMTCWEKMRLDSCSSSFSKKVVEEQLAFLSGHRSIIPLSCPTVLVDRDDRGIHYQGLIYEAVLVYNSITWSSNDQKAKPLRLSVVVLYCSTHTFVA